MANVKKFNLQAVHEMFIHYGRKENDGVERGNKTIKPELTHLNYNLGPVHIGEDGQEMTQYQFLQKRLAEVKHRNLNSYKDDKVMCCWCVTKPENVPIEKSREFFESVYKFCSDKYGEENVISANVHMDETTPHMHFSFVPVVKDDKGERLCAKERISRVELQQFHPKLQEYVEGRMKQEVGICNGATEGGNLTIAEMKFRKALEQLAEVEATTAALETINPIIEEAVKLIEEVTEEYRMIDKALKAKKWFGDDDKAKMQALTKELEKIKSTAETTSKTIEQIQQTVEELPNNINKHWEGVFKSFEEAKKKEMRRIKRTEAKLVKRMKAVEEREKSIDEEVKQGVQRELAKYDEQIHQKKEESKRLDDEIDAKIDTIEDLNITFWTQTDYLRQAERNNQYFTNILEGWKKENESSILQSDVFISE